MDEETQLYRELDELLAHPRAQRELFDLIRETTGGDFSHYKTSTLSRRIGRRVRMGRFESLDAYLKALHESPHEVAALREDLLISVTRFFRDPEVFDHLRTAVLPNMLTTAANRGGLRVWVPGCASGEEAYSMAITLLEAARETGVQRTFTVIGTDVNEASLDRARGGSYPHEIADAVNEELLSRYFDRVEDRYVVNDATRRMCRFERQDVVTDDPLTGVHLVSMRNVLIYMDRDLQRRVIGSLHRSLVPDGILVLGTAETVSADSQLFSAVSAKRKIYRSASGQQPPSTRITRLL